jgi:DNA-binding LacI/PurR family transcriptional regulator
MAGVTFSAALLGVEYYSNTPRGLAEPADLGMFVDLEVQAVKVRGTRGHQGVHGGTVRPGGRGGSAAADIGTASGTTALVAFNDLLAIGVLQRLQHLGIDVPGEVSVVGFDETFGSDFCHSPLTTVTAPVEQAGRMLIDLLLGTRDVKPTPHIALPSVLRVRDSTGPAASR